MGWGPRETRRSTFVFKEPPIQRKEAPQRPQATRSMGQGRCPQSGLRVRCRSISLPGGQGDTGAKRENSGKYTADRERDWDRGCQACRMMRDKEQQDPDPKVKGLECHTKELRPYLLGLGESTTDSNGGVTGSGMLLRTVSGDDVEDGFERNGLKPAESTRAAEQTGHDVMRS